jgi:enoyl-CoA hydratase
VFFIGFKDLLVESENRVITVKLNRPDVLNALRENTFHELDEVLSIFENDPLAGAMIITGIGDRAFSAGGDVKVLEALTSTEALQFAQLTHKILDKIEHIDKPVIAAVNGFAFGAGCDLAVACDLVVASEKAVFGEPSAGLGITTPFGGTQRLPRIIGPKRAMHLFLTGDSVDAETALSYGLVNKVVKHEVLLIEAKEVAEKILSKAPIAIKYLKRLINLSITSSLKDGDEAEKDLYSRCFDTEDKKEGMRAFIEKRKPVFKGK